MSRYLRAGKVPAMQKGGHIFRKGRGQERACFGEVPGEVIPRGAGGCLEDWENRCPMTLHRLLRVQRAGVGRWVQPKYSAWAKDHVLMGFGSSRL